MSKQRIEKWQRWIVGTIKNNVLAMRLQRDAWLAVSAMLRANPDLPESYWWGFMRDTYATTQAVAVRRQGDTHKDVASLGKLIEEIRDDSKALTREWWLGLWREPGDAINPNNMHDKLMLMQSERGWTQQHAGTVGKHQDPAIPAADFDTLTTAAADVKAYVDQHVAHAEKPPSAPVEITLTLNDVHDDIDVIGKRFEKYYNLLTANFYTQLVPVIQHNWMAAFEVPWMPSGYSPP